MIDKSPQNILLLLVSFATRHFPPELNISGCGFKRMYINKLLTYNKNLLELVR